MNFRLRTDCRLVLGLSTALLLIAAAPAEAGSAYGPTGLGSNLHRRFVKKQAVQNARRGRPQTRHAGVWIAGGYPGTRSGQSVSHRPVLHPAVVQPSYGGQRIVHQQFMHHPIVHQRQAAPVPVVQSPVYSGPSSATGIVAATPVSEYYHRPVSSGSRYHSATSIATPAQRIVISPNANGLGY